MLSKRFSLLLLISRFVDPHEDAKPGETNRQSFKLDTKAPFAHQYY